jgi:Holliday junction resolvase RusA-like endonuclease
MAMMRTRPYSGFIGIEMEIICSAPKSWSKKRKELGLTGKLFPTHCDMDNQIKSICDGMSGIVFADDRLINSLVVRREFGQEDRVIVTVRIMNCEGRRYAV